MFLRNSEVHVEPLWDQFLISLRVYLRWVHDARFGTLLGPVGTRVTLGPLGSPLGRMISIDASEAPQIHKKYKKCTFSSGFLKILWKRSLNVYTPCISVVCKMDNRFIWDICERYISWTGGVLSSALKSGTCYRKATHAILYAICSMLSVRRYMLYVMCYMLYVICYTIHVIRCMIDIIYFTFWIQKLFQKGFKNGPFWPPNRSVFGP